MSRPNSAGALLFASSLHEEPAPLADLGHLLAPGCHVHPVEQLTSLELSRTFQNAARGLMDSVGLALGFMFQDIASSCRSGVTLAMYRAFDSGDAVEFSGWLGVAKVLSLRATQAETLDGLSFNVHCAQQGGAAKLHG